MDWFVLIIFIFMLAMYAFTLYQIAYSRGQRKATARKCKWNYISEVGLPSREKYDWVLIKTDFDGGTGIPHIAELRGGKWWSMDIELGPIEEVLHCRVVAWADMELIEDGKYRLANAFEQLGNDIRRI